jgi:hypothetical protein
MNQVRHPGQPNFTGRGVHALSAIRVCETFVASKPKSGLTRVRPFVYVSAEDFSRPLVSVRYLETKREAEKRIEEIVRDHPQYKGIYVRPSKYTALVIRFDE